VWFTRKASSSNFSPYIDSPPVPNIKLLSVCEEKSRTQRRAYHFPRWSRHPGTWICATTIIRLFTQTTRTQYPLITRWKPDPLKCRGFPSLPSPFSPVHNAPILWVGLNTTGITGILLTKILCCFRDKIIIQRKYNATCGFFADTDIKICNRSLQSHVDSQRKDRSMSNVCLLSTAIKLINISLDKLRNSSESAGKCEKYTALVSLCS